MTRARMPRPHEVAAARRDPRLLRAFRERQDDGAWRTRGACSKSSTRTSRMGRSPEMPIDHRPLICRPFSTGVFILSGE